MEEQFRGTPLADINTVKIQTLAASLGAKALSMSSLLATVSDLAEMASQADIRLEGKSNLLGYKEYSDNLPSLLKFLGDEEPLSMLVSSGEASGPGIEVRIGSENRFSELSNSTTIISRYFSRASAISFKLPFLDTGTVGKPYLWGPTSTSLSLTKCFALLPGITHTHFPMEILLKHLKTDIMPS